MPSTITGSVKKLTGTSAQSGDRFELLEFGGGTPQACLFAVVIPPSKTLPQYRLPELDHYFVKYFPGARIEPGPVARTTPLPTNLRWRPNLETAKRDASAQRRSVLLLITDQSTSSFEKETLLTPEFIEYAEENLVPIGVIVNSWNGDEVPARRLQRQYAVTNPVHRKPKGIAS